MRISLSTLGGPSRLRSLPTITSPRLPLYSPRPIYPLSSRSKSTPPHSRPISTTPHRASASPLYSTHPKPPPGPASASTSSPSTFSTINDSEISHFSRLASEWWSESGEFALLHRMNPARIEYMRQLVAFDTRSEPEWTFADRHNDRSREEAKGVGRWLGGKRVLDVGCGGGLLSEALARLGGDIIGVDASGVNIGMAVAHAAGDPGLPLVNPVPEGMDGSGHGHGEGRGSLEYRHTSAEALRDAGEQFDVVCAMEVVEHVDEPGEFLKALGDMVRPGGHLILSTISRTPLSQLLTLTLAEDVLRLVTPGTHTYSKYIKPEEIRQFVYKEMGGYKIWEKEEDAGDVRMDEVGRTRGIVYDPLAATWRLWGGVEGGWAKSWGEGCNYMFGVRKRVDAQR